MTPDDDLPLVRELPRRADPGTAGSRKIKQWSTTAGTAWAFAWFFFGPDEGAVRWYVGAAGLVAVAAVRIWLHTHGAKALDVSHLDLALEQTQVRRGDTVRARLRVTETRRPPGQLSAKLVCSETYAWRSRSTNDSGPSRRDSTRELLGAPITVRQGPGEQVIEFHLPPDRPPSWRGDFVTYHWVLVVREHIPRGLDPTLELPLEVLP